jgi:hypothetical protein
VKRAALYQYQEFDEHTVGRCVESPVPSSEKEFYLNGYAEIGNQENMLHPIENCFVTEILFNGKEIDRQDIGTEGSFYTIRQAVDVLLFSRTKSFIGGSPMENPPRPHDLSPYLDVDDDETNPWMPSEEALNQLKRVNK